MLPPAATCQLCPCDCAEHSGTHTAPVSANAKIAFRIGLYRKPASEQYVPIIRSTLRLEILSAGPKFSWLYSQVPLLGMWKQPYLESPRIPSSRTWHDLLI